MKNAVLTPSDGYMIKLVKSVTGKEPQLEYTDTGFRMYWECPNVIDKPEWQRHEALKDAIQGRLGNRFESFRHENHMQYVYFKPDADNLIDRFETYDLKEPDDSVASLFKQRSFFVKAMQVTSENAVELAAFTGGGTLVVQDSISYSFVNENGLYMDAQEGCYIVNDNGHFYVMSPRNFLYHFEESKTITKD